MSAAAEATPPAKGPAGGRGVAVTLVLTDVEGSTRLWADHPAEMATAMGRHHHIIHTAVAEHGGWRPVDQGEGDAVFAVFDVPSAAVEAVTSIQRQLGAESWPAGVTIRVRIGVHAGEVVVRDGNVHGSTVNRCARLRGLGGGGQVLLSASVFEQVRDHLPDGVRVTDLGEHRMKDLTRPEHIHQLVIPGLTTEFPPLASLDRARHNLPIQTSTFLGRDTEVRDLIELVSRERLVTVLGFGGMGKTRLALQVSAELAIGDGDGVWFIDLSAETDPQRIPAMINVTLGISEGPNGPLPTLLAELAKKRLLLVLDNLEQLLPDGARIVADLTAAGPDIRVLVTSREPLRVRGERVFPLSPLPVPPPPRPPLTEAEVGRLSTYTAVSLFLTRAAAARRDFVLTPQNAAAVAAICSRLDGLPLAIELAAARTRMISPEALLPRLDNALKMLVGGSRDLPTRHQTLRATIAWSYDTLEPDQQQLLDRLSVFPGTFTLDAAEAICGAPTTADEDDLDVLDAMTVLVDRSLVRVHPATDAQPEDRYSLLVSIRDYAAEHLDHAGLTRLLADRHVAHYAAMTSYHPDDTWDDILRADRLRRDELHHLRAALAHTHTRSTPDQEQTLAALLVPALQERGQQTEARTVAHQALDRSDKPTSGGVRISIALAHRAVEMFRWDEARPDLDAALIAARRVGDPTLLVETLGLALSAARSTEEYRNLANEGETVLARSTSGPFQLPWWFVRNNWDRILSRSPLTPWSDAEAAGRRQLAAAPAERQAVMGLHLALMLSQHGRWLEAAEFLPVWETADGPPHATPHNRLVGAGNASEVRMALGQLDVATMDVDLLERLVRDNDAADFRADLNTRRAALDRLNLRLQPAIEHLQEVTGDDTASASDRAYARRLLAVVYRELAEDGKAAHQLHQAWQYVVEQDGSASDLAVHCLLERAVTTTETDPREATRLIGLVRIHRDTTRFADFGVVYDTDAMLTDLRTRLGDRTVDDILTEAATEPLPDRLDWTTSEDARRKQATTD